MIVGCARVVDIEILIAVFDGGFKRVRAFPAACGNVLAAYFVFGVRFGRAEPQAERNGSAHIAVELHYERAGFVAYRARALAVAIEDVRVGYEREGIFGRGGENGVNDKVDIVFEHIVVHNLLVYKVHIGRSPVVIGNALLSPISRSITSGFSFRCKNF